MTVIEGIIANLYTGCDKKDLRLGWDYWIPSSASTPNSDIKPSIKLTPYTDGYGIGRAIHPYVLDKRTLPDGAKPIFSEDMDARQIANGIWRRSLIQPGSYDFHGGDYEIGSIDADCASNEHLIALIGHKPSDLAHWLIYLKRSPKYQSAFKLLLSNKFKDCLKLFPELKYMKWPFRPKEEYLTPFYVAVLYAELGRAAVNQAGLLQISTDDGIELTTKGVLDRLKASHGSFNSLAIKRHLEYAPLQTIAFGLPDQVIENKDKEMVSIWANAVAGRLLYELGTGGTLDITPDTPDKAVKIMECFSVHSQYEMERANEDSFAYKARKAGFFWGLTAHINPAVRLLEIASTARKWNEKYCPKGPKLPSVKDCDTGNPIAKALATIQYQWLYEHDRRLATKFLQNREVIEKEEKEKGSSSKKTPKNPPRKRVIHADPLSLLNYLGEKSGLTLQKDALVHLNVLPKPGEMGYTARSQAHLWLDDDGDDIDHFKKLLPQAIKFYQKTIDGKLDPELQDTSRVPRSVAELVHKQHGSIGGTNKRSGKINPIKLCPDENIVYLAQEQSQSICFQSTDPMYARLIREVLQPKDKSSPAASSQPESKGEDVGPVQ
ncbi:hypothetical protein EOE18_18020 [Novosphingobium umbonatum]|uniref:Uncharacterized protein n=1 Tax=Novosphingobium umbonatum TaxID=1908524 RepID=A0A437MWZ0_9SPHN|nr:hypothetical protein [Novosphingobium umbonatum]RVU02149.1 hypothetical protein EOE18_18020 [Novosphingobium umbonatum]